MAVMDACINPFNLVGIPYADMDCYSLVRHCARECYGLAFPELTEYLNNTPLIVSQELAKPNWLEVPYYDRAPGDLVTLSYTPKAAGHVGIVIDGLFILHNDRKLGALIEDDIALRRRGWFYRHVYRLVK